MPELPDIAVYLEALRARTQGHTLESIRIVSPALLRTALPPPSAAAAEGRTVRDLRRIGKRVVFELDDGLFLVIHLMVAGRFLWKPAGNAPIQRIVYASNETNYCAPCQTGGKLLVDRALSRLLKKDWPRTIEELEARTAGRRNVDDAS